MSKPVINAVKAVGRLTQGFGFLGQAALAVMVITICYDVVMRYVFNAPTHWSLEVNTFLVIFITMIPACAVLRENSHLRIEFFISKFSPKTQDVIRRVASVLGVCLCALMVRNGLIMAISAFTYDQRMSTPLGTPMGIPYLFIPVGFTLLGLQFLARLFAPGITSKTEEVPKIKST
jgi:TRAP-type C4-dicarboxylate transport system permease small subunit